MEYGMCVTQSTTKSADRAYQRDYPCRVNRRMVFTIRTVRRHCRHYSGQFEAPITGRPTHRTS